MIYFLCVFFQVVPNSAVNVVAVVVQVVSLAT